MRYAVTLYFSRIFININFVPLSLKLRDNDLFKFKIMRPWLEQISFQGYGLIFKILKLTGYGPAGGGTLIFSYTRRLRLFAGVIVLNFNVLGGFRKMNFIFFGVYMMKLWIFWGSS